MQAFLARIWAFYTKHTLVRHAITGLVAVVIVESAPALTDWAKGFFNTETVQAVAIGVIGSLVRWAQIQLEALMRSMIGTDPAPESPAEA